jgi:hypothetical protein
MRQLQLGRIVRRVTTLGALVALLMALGGCGSGNNTNNIDGRWSGFDGNNVFGNLIGSAFTLSQNGTHVTGTTNTTGANNTPLYSGSISGEFNSPTFIFTLTVPVGNIAGRPACSMTLSGTASLTNFGTLGGGTQPTENPKRQLYGDKLLHGRCYRRLQSHARLTS